MYDPNDFNTLEDVSDEEIFLKKYPEIPFKFSQMFTLYSYDLRAVQFFHNSCLIRRIEQKRIYKKLKT